MDEYYLKYLKYKYKYLNLKQKGGAINKAPEGKPEVYYPFFHSCHSDETKVVPEGCVIVNTSVCGLPTYFQDSISKKFRELFKKKDERLRNPLENKESLTIELGKPIVIHTPGSNYLDMNFSYHLITSFSKTEDREDVEQECCGLMSLDNGFCDEGISFNKRGNRDFPKHLILPLYKNSVYPTEEEIGGIPGKKLNGFTINDFFRGSSNERFGKLTLSKLLTMYPGVYYITSCRPPCEVEEKIDGRYKFVTPDETRKAIRLQRQTSLNILSDDEKILQLNSIINEIVKYNLYLEQQPDKNYTIKSDKFEILRESIREYEKITPDYKSDLFYKKIKKNIKNTYKEIAKYDTSQKILTEIKKLFS